MKLQRFTALTSGLFASLTLIVLFSQHANGQTTPASPNAQGSTAAAKSTGDKVLFKTDMGDIEILLYADKAPISTQNFLAYVDSGFYNGIIFHRVIPKFVVQFGGFTDDMKKKKTRSPIKNEASNGLANRRGTLSMARTSNPNSATSQVFINLVDNPSLNAHGGSAGYAVFGEVTKGMDIVDAIAQVPRTTVSRYRDVPKKPIRIIAAKRL